MAIRVNPTSSSLNTSGYLHGVNEVKAIKIPGLGNTACTLSLLGACKRDIPAFAYLTDEDDDYRNDFRSFIYEVPNNATLTAKLIEVSPNGTETEHTITDNTYGNLFTVNTLKDDVWGFILRWHDVADNLGFGCYKFNVTIVNAAMTELLNETTPCFNLKPWSCEAAHRTVKVTTHQRGYVVNGFDYRGISFFISTAGGLGQTNFNAWPQELRWYGRFKKTTPTYVNEVNKDSFWNDQQIQSSIVKNYTLRFDLIYAEMLDPFLEDHFLAGEIYISDYSINATNVFDHIRINPVDITDLRVIDLNPNQFLTIEVDDFNKGTVKRH